MSTTFAKNMHAYAKRMRDGKTIELSELNGTQQKEVLRQAGSASTLSPEGMAHAMESYISALQQQANVAKAFYVGDLEKGVEGLSSLPEDVRLQIDQLIWEAANGEPIDPTLQDAQYLIASAIMHSVEMRMGILD